MKLKLPILPLVGLLALGPHSPLRALESQGLVLPFKQVSVSSPVMQDIIREIAVEEGDKVSEGQVLAQLENAKEELDVQQYTKMVERREFEAKGMRELLKDKMVSQDTALEKNTELELAKIARKLAAVRLEEKTIKAPLSGTVVKKYKEAGEAVDRVEKLFDIINIDKVYLQFYLEPKLMDSVQVGKKVAVKFDSQSSGSATHLAEISYVEPRIDAASGLFRVKLLLDNQNHEIKAGMRCTADFSKLE
jgi:RND family efflux transporter MFP subunit